ncbi:hypothetical protein [Nocardia spumae]|uniref:hypothetical protein n=1 Tax=Nocardia spumae TaxID=2887190 RepID=UPI001D15010B|nr:hypothetical protein [Nocardia spumae]
MTFENQRIYLIAGPVAAVTMPSDLGFRVKPLLRDIFGCHGPIIAHPRARRWTFLANPDGSDRADPVLHAELFRVHISLAPAGSEVALPAPIDVDLVYRMWNVLPPNSFRPWVGSVIDVARRE